MELADESVGSILLPPFGWLPRVLESDSEPPVPVKHHLSVTEYVIAVSSFVDVLK